MFRKHKLRKIAKQAVAHLTRHPILALFPYLDYPVNLTRDELEFVLNEVNATHPDLCVMPLIVNDDTGTLVFLVVAGHNPVEVWNLVYHQCKIARLQEDGEPDPLDDIWTNIQQDLGIVLDRHPEMTPLSRAFVKAWNDADKELV